jgi:hypothetical protein
MTMPNETGKTTSRVLDWAALVRQAWGPEFNQPDKCYQFSNGREFNATDGQRGGIYEGTSA